MRFITTDSLETEIENDRKLSFLLRATELLNVKKNARFYSCEDLVRSFTWFSQSRVLYNLRHSKIPRALYHTVCRTYVSTLM